MSQGRLPKLIAIVGPTAAGKTEWSLRLSSEIGGEVVSADSRQIYKKMNIGTAKEPGEWRFLGWRRTYSVRGIPHYLVDFLDPGKVFTAAQFRDRALKYIKIIYKNSRVPLLVGGTGLYISTLLDNYQMPRLPPNQQLRRGLEEKNLDELFALLQKLDPISAQKIDRKNKRRLVRALEVCILSGESFALQSQRGEPLFDVLKIGVRVERSVLHERIHSRVEKMVALGLVEEVKNLVKQKYSWDLPSMSGVGYRQFADFFAGKTTLSQTIEILKRDTRRFARRQETWFRRDKSIEWFDSYDQAEKRAWDFLRS